MGGRKWGILKNGISNLRSKRSGIYTHTDAAAFHGHPPFALRRLRGGPEPGPGRYPTLASRMATSGPRRRFGWIWMSYRMRGASAERYPYCYPRRMEVSVARSDSQARACWALTTNQYHEAGLLLSV